MKSVVRWKDLIARIVSGASSDDDHAEAQAGVIDGGVVLTSGSRSLFAGGNIGGSIVITGSHNQIHVNLEESTLEAVREKLFPNPSGVLPPFPSLLFVGRARVMEDIREQLVHPARAHFMIIRGWPGVGKTTAVGMLGRDRRLLNTFPDGILWASLGQNPSLLSVLASWGSALGSDAILRCPTLSMAVERLRGLLHPRKLLLLVDDIWSASHAAPFLAACGPDCAVVATTREPQVAESFTSNRAFVYTLPVLDEQSAMELLQAIAPAITQNYHRESEDLVRALECLPLAIHVAGRLLTAEAKYGWGIAELLHDLRTGTAVLTAPAPDDRSEGEVIPTVSALLKKSTDLLSDAVRDYYAFLGVFAPKPATFDLEALRGVWEVSDPKPVVRELVGRGLLEPVGHGRFQMHALLVAHARSLLV
jgi:hypothetical protein